MIAHPLIELLYIHYNYFLKFINGNKNAQSILNGTKGQIRIQTNCLIEFCVNKYMHSTFVAKCILEINPIRKLTVCGCIMLVTIHLKVSTHFLCLPTFLLFPC